MNIIIFATNKNVNEDYTDDFNEIIKSLKAKEDVASQEQKQEETSKEEAAPKQEETPKEEEVSREYKNALKKAESYAKYMNMSKQGIYDQLTSEYGENFPEDAAQYAMAANMIGVKKRFIVVEFMNMPLVMINPKIVSKHDRYETEEGCLSLSGMRKAVRYRNITVAYEDMQFVSHTQAFTGFTAQIIQHEIDHCDGILI